MEGIAPDGAPVWLALIVGGLVFVAQAFPKILGPIGSSVDEWAKRKRKAAVTKDDADIAERDRQIEYLNGRVTYYQDRQAAQDSKIIEHMKWDQGALRVHPDLGQPPKLWP